MAQRVELEVAPRTVMGKANKRLRKAGILPGNIYGHKEASIPIQIDEMTFDHMRREHGSRSILSLQLPNANSQTAIIRHVQRNPLTGRILHIDFTRVSMEERINVKVPLHFVGVAPGVKLEGGVLLPIVEALEVECRATDLVDAIEVDISPLTEIESSLHARDVRLPANYKLLSDANEVIVKVEAPRVEPVVEAAATVTEEQPAGEAETKTSAE
jgi:large subunit ribosomal protein L25